MHRVSFDHVEHLTGDYLAQPETRAVSSAFDGATTKSPRIRMLIFL
jgi:hypothetical protein